MSDRYKFRGKRKDNGQWSKGSLVVWGNARYIVAIVIPKGQEVYFVPDFPSGKPLIEVDPATVGQFTGLADKNGKEIYEGDICKLNGIYGSDDYEVRFGKAVFEIHSEKRVLTDLLLYVESKEIEVIGNIHDNPELLKQAQKP
jgi:uncharacterized phage protein (TIGR01671 family)